MFFYRVISSILGEGISELLGSSDGYRTNYINQVFLKEHFFFNPMKYIILLKFKPTLFFFYNRVSQQAIFLLIFFVENMKIDLCIRTFFIFLCCIYHLILVGNHWNKQLNFFYMKVPPTRPGTINYYKMQRTDASAN